MVSSSHLPLPLPVSWEECKARGWDHIDILLVTGDAYIDHPSFGTAIIGRLLEHHGYKVCILSQPRYDSVADFKSFPKPKLFCGITGGNLDSIVANYSGNGKVRDKDAYSSNGNPWRGDKQSKAERLRPDRASLIYTSLARAAFGKIPIILGGIEASLRRFVHYDFKQSKLRASFLTDAKADLLVYGMGEKAVVEIAKRCSLNQSLTAIPGTCERLTENELLMRFPEAPLSNSRHHLVLPSWSAIGQDKNLFLDAEIEIDRHLRAYSKRKLWQRQQSHWVVQHPPGMPLSPEELDALYTLPYTRLPHPAAQQIPAFTMIKDSVTIVRGCSGNCSFCAITRHQGPAITSRSVDSIVSECKNIAQTGKFSGTISDLGGPTANLFGTSCKIGSCKKRDCLYPEPCKHLEINEDQFLQLLQKVSEIEGIKNLFVSSGLRMALLLRTPKLLRQLLLHHTPGSMKIAPEHTDDTVLQLMHKEPHHLLQKFIGECREIAAQTGKKKISFSPYIISSHPGSTQKHAKKLAQDLQKLGLTVRKFQDFTPTPGTLSTAMYVTGLSPENKDVIDAVRNQSERMKQRKIIEESFRMKKRASKKKYPQKKK